MNKLKKIDPKIFEIIKNEEKRQVENLSLIPSENYASFAVLEALGSVFTNKYAEGEPKKRYYQGNEFVDELELLVCDRALKLFKLDPSVWHVNVKGVSAGIANFIVLTALLEPHNSSHPGGKIMSMFLPDGGHLSHGWKIADKPINFSSKIFQVVHYKVDERTKTFNYDRIADMAEREKPQIIISGGTAYPREINYERMSKIAKNVGAFYMTDIAHEAGLVAGNANTSPFPYADVITMSTQKTLRGPRGAMIFCRKELAEKIDRAIFPGLQGGPFMNVIAAIGVALKEASSGAFKSYAKQVVKNAKVLSEELKKYNFEVVSGGTDKHLVLVDLRSKHMNGKEAALMLESAGLVLNKNTVPYETGSPFSPSGIRLGTPAITSRGMKEKEMKKIAKWIHESLDERRDPHIIKKEVITLCKKFKTPGITK